MWMDILKSFEEQLKQGIKELEMNKVFDIQYNGMRRNMGLHENHTRFEFIIKFDGSKYFQLSMSGEKGIGRDADTYRMIITKFESPDTAYANNLTMKLELAVVTPTFKIRTSIISLSEFLEKVDEKLVDFYVYLRSEAATPYLAEEKE
mgnify:CR=1 FL=1